MSNIQNFLALLVCLVFMMPIANAETKNTSQDEHIRNIVKDMLHEKDEKIESLEARIQQLEQSLSTEKSKQASVEKKTDEENKDEESINNKFAELTGQVQKMREKAEENGLEINGFFDFSARTENKAESTFSLGAVEIDLEYAYNDHFAASSALVWDGDAAEIGVAVVDYHSFDDSIPVRGRIFSGKGFHLQAGRFDLPFSTDYQFFAAPDRLTVSAPMTTERIQQGGYNGDGVRVYGSWNQFNYAAFWTNSVYEDEGSSVGGRLGVSLGQNSYRLHRQDAPGILELGVSHLTDLDGSVHSRRSVYGADLSFNYNIFSLQGEFLWLDSHEDFINADEFAYHATLFADLESFIHHPVRTYVRYGSWNPDYATRIDGDDTYLVEDISRLTVGFNYSINEYLMMKFEYTDSLGSETEEPDFEKHLGTAQLVVAF